MSFLRIATIALLAAVAGSAQTATNITVNANASLVGTTNYTFQGTANLAGFGQGILSGGGSIPSQVLAGQTAFPIPGHFTLAYPDGTMTGTVSIPAGIFIPLLGNPGSATGVIRITGGTGRYEGVRALFPNATGSGTSTSQTSTTIMVQGNGTIAIGLKVLSQLAFGGGWYSAIYLTNTTNNTQSFIVNYVGNDGTPLNVPSQNGTFTSVGIAPGGSAKIEFPNSGSLVQGYATMVLPSGVDGYGVFRQSVNGIPDQEAVVPLVNGFSTYSTLTFDDTTYTTAVAIVNPSETATTININAKSQTGASLGVATLNLAAKSKTALVLRDIPGLTIAGARGSVTFTVPTGNVNVLGLRFNGSAFTSIPASDLLQ